MKNNKIKVLQIVSTPAGGIRKHIVDIIKGLSAEQYELGLAASLKDADKVFQAEKSLIDTLCHGRIYDITIDKKPSFQDLKNIYHLFRLIQKEHYDILHGHGAKGGVYARILGKLLGAKVIYTPHGGSLHSMHGRFKNIIYAMIEKALYFITNRLIFESDYSRQSYFNKVCDATKKSVVNYNGIEIIGPYSPKNPPTPDRIIKICAFGILRYVKGHDILIKAAKHLIEKGYKIQVNIYGSGEEQTTLQTLIKHLHLQNIVFLRGETNQTIELMKQHDILVHPSRFESFGYVVIEAMSVGLPVIASEVGGLTELIDDHINGLLIKCLSPDDLAETIQKLIENPELYMEISQAGHANICKKFSITKMLSGLDTIYHA